VADSLKEIILFGDGKCKRGKWYLFSLDESHDSNFPGNINFPGTYIIFVKGECLYVGQSMNILKRLKDHIRMARYTNTWKTPWGYYSKILFAIRRERFRYERLAIEKRFIEKFKPKHNVLLKSNDE